MNQSTKCHCQTTQHEQVIVYKCLLPEAVCCCLQTCNCWFVKYVCHYAVHPCTTFHCYRTQYIIGTNINNFFLVVIVGLSNILWCSTPVYQISLLQDASYRYKQVFLPEAVCCCCNCWFVKYIVMQYTRVPNFIVIGRSIEELQVQKNFCPRLFVVY